MTPAFNPRDDGDSKVRGRAGYVDDLRPADVGFDFLHAVAVTSGVARGRVVAIDAGPTLATPGVRAVVDHRNAPRLSRIFSVGMGEIAELPPLQDDRVRYFGQCVAIVGADDLHAAREGARRLAVAYRPDPAAARVSLDREGRCLVECAAAEIGQGLTTGLRTIAAQSMGLPREAIALRCDTTNLPYGAGSVAATGAYSNGASIHEAARRVKARLFAFAVSDPASPFHGMDPARLAVEDGVVVGGGNARESVAALMRRHPRPIIAEKVVTGRDFGSGKSMKASFGAVFARVSLDPITLDLRVERLVGAYDCGRILEPRIARAQVVGGMIWGLGQALMEETRVDRAAGRWSNAELGEALAPTCADVPPIDVVFAPSGEPDAASPSIRIVVGGLAARPWRSRPAERSLLGGAIDAPAARAAAEIVFEDASPDPRDAAMVELGRRTVERALLSAAEEARRARAW